VSKLTEEEPVGNKSPLQLLFSCEFGVVVMSLASDLLHSTNKRRDSGEWQGVIEDPQERLLRLGNVVYGLLAEHEPSGSIEAILRADLRIMSLSGSVCENDNRGTCDVCRQASQVMAELRRLLPRCRE
jgi:hypothetical protein